MRDMSIAQVTIEKHTHSVLDFYERRFKEKFGEAPNVEEEDRVVARWLVQQYEIEKARDFTDRYLSFPNNWIAEQGYPLRLMRKNINALIVSMPRKRIPVHSRISVEVYCDSGSCGRPFKRLVEMGHNWNETNACDACIEAGKVDYPDNSKLLDPKNVESKAKVAALMETLLHSKSSGIRDLNEVLGL